MTRQIVLTGTNATTVFVNGGTMQFAYQTQASQKMGKPGTVLSVLSMLNCKAFGKKNQPFHENSSLCGHNGTPTLHALSL